MTARWHLLEKYEIYRGSTLNFSFKETWNLLWQHPDTFILKKCENYCDSTLTPLI
jgi:hypothetical protein